MQKGWDEKIAETWIEQFKRAAILFHGGIFLGIQPIEQAASKACGKLIRKLDADCPNGREILIPLLQDKDPNVQVIAAQYLLASHPELALPVLRHLKTRPPLAVADTAGYLIMAHEDGRYSW